jgi:hypothetical protein
LPNAKSKKIDYSSSAARLLSESVNEPYTAVICTKEAGLHFGLFPVMDNLQDEVHNHTEFRMVSAADFSHLLHAKFWKKVFVLLYSKKWRKYTIEVLLSMFLSAALYFGAFMEVAMSEVLKVSFSTLTAVLSFLSQQHLGKLLINTMITGRWVYYPIVEDDARLNDTELKCIIPRLVKIEQDGGSIFITGKHADNPETIVFQSALHVDDDLGDLSGDAIFEFAHHHTQNQRTDFSGIAKLSWKVKETGADIFQMNGQYWGHKKAVFGTMKFYRIEATEYDRIQTANFLSNYNRSR